MPPWSVNKVTVVPGAVVTRGVCVKTRAKTCNSSCWRPKCIFGTPLVSGRSLDMQRSKHGRCSFCEFVNMETPSKQATIIDCCSVVAFSQAVFSRSKCCCLRSWRSTCRCPPSSIPPTAAKLPMSSSVQRSLPPIWCSWDCNPGLVEVFSIVHHGHCRHPGGRNHF